MKYVVLAVYVVLLITFGIISKRKVSDLNDFYLGGRKIGPWMSAFSYGTTYFSAVIFIGYAGTSGWNFGLPAVLIGIGNAVVGSLFAWLVLAKRTRSMTQRLNVSTMPSFFEKRYDSKALKIVSALVIFIFLVPYSASVFQGLSYLVEHTLGIPYAYCIIGMAVIAGIYLLFGGYFATSLTDFFQGIVMLVGIVLVVFFIVGNPLVGGLSAGVERLAAIDPGLVSLNTSGGIVPLISLILLTSMGTWALPQMVHKFYAIKDEKSVKTGTIISTIFALVVGAGAYFSGVWGRLFLNNQIPVDPVTGLANSDLIMPTVLQTALPEILLGVVIILVLSASMSTLTSLVLTSSSAISIDLLQGALKPQMSNKKTMSIMRVMCAVFLLASVLIALNKISAILTLMSFSWGTVSGSFIGPYVYGLYWKKTTRAGAWAGFFAGLLISLVLAIVTGFQGSLAPTIGVIAMASSLFVTPIVSLFTKKYGDAHLETIFGAGK